MTYNFKEAFAAWWCSDQSCMKKLAMCSVKVLCLPSRALQVRLAMPCPVCMEWDMNLYRGKWLQGMTCALVPAEELPGWHWLIALLAIPSKACPQLAQESHAVGFGGSNPFLLGR